MARGYGRCPTGRRCLGRVPNGHWQSSTFIAALRAEKITAPFLLEGAVNAEAFLAYLPPYSPDLNPMKMAFAKLKATCDK